MIKKGADVVTMADNEIQDWMKAWEEARRRAWDNDEDAAYDQL